MAVAETNWPTVCASEVRQGFQDRSRGMKGSQESLTTAVVKDAANWRTPTAEALGTGKHMDSADLKLGARVYNKNGKLMAIDLNRQVEIVARQHGQAAPASSSSLGSRQGLWPTPEGMAGGKTCRGGNRKDELLLSGTVKQWATPNACDHKGATTPEACKQWESRGQNLPEQTASIAAGRLNPRWVETLMGLPIGWTMPSCTSPQTIAPMSCDSSAMELCPPPQSELSEFSLAS
jgi:hypothetical protein